MSKTNKELVRLVFLIKKLNPSMLSKIITFKLAHNKPKS